MEIEEDGEMVECSRAGMCIEESERRGAKLKCLHGQPHKHDGLCIDVHTDRTAPSICGLHVCIEVMDKTKLADPDDEWAPNVEAPGIKSADFETPKTTDIQYKVLQEYTALDIALAVNTCIGQGWYPQGGVSTVRIKEKKTYLTIYSQAMIKEI